MAGPLYPQIDPNRYRGGISGRGIAKALAKRMFNRPLYTKGDPMADVRMGASGAYQDQVKPFVDFARRPGIGTGLGAGMVAIPGFRGVNRKIGGKLMLGEHRLKQANANRVDFGNQMSGPNPLQPFLDALPEFTGKVRPGRTYKIPNFRSKLGVSVDDRVAIIQDPQTGAMFAAPGALHGELIEKMASTGKLPVSKDPAKWMQHEVFSAMEDINVPSRILWGLNENLDNRMSTMARMRLLGNLSKAGIKAGKATKAPSYRERLAAPGANKAMANMLAEVLKRKVPHKR